MRTILELKLLWVGFSILVVGLQTSLSQVGPAFTILSPYERQDRAGQRLGGVSVAVPDGVANVTGNPANLVFINHPGFLASLTYSNREFSLTQEWSERTAAETHFRRWEMGYCALSLPVELLKKQWVVAASYNGRQWSRMDERFFNSAVKALAGYNLQRTGHLGSASLGLATRPFAKLSLGVGWTKWFGKTEWKYSTISEGSADFAAQGWHLGLNSQVGPFSLGTVFYLPHKVMSGKGEVVEGIDWLRRQAVTTQTQEFRGAIDLGIAYRLRSWTFGLDYAYQKSTAFEYKEGQRQYKDMVRAEKRIGAGVEYMFRIARLRLPIYFAYRAYLLPEDESFVPWQYWRITELEQRDFWGEWDMGFALLYRSLGLYTSATWSRSSCEMSGTDFLTPPWS